MFYALHIIQRKTLHNKIEDKQAKSPLKILRAPLSTSHHINAKSIYRRKRGLKKVAGYLSISRMSKTQDFAITFLTIKPN